MENDTQNPTPETQTPEPEPTQQVNPPTHSNKTKIYGILGIVVLVLIGLAVSMHSRVRVSDNKTSVPPTDDESAVSGMDNTDEILVEPEIEALTGSGYVEASISLKNTPNFEAVKQKYSLKLTASQENFLDQNKFLLVDADATSLKPGINFDAMLNNFDSLGGSGSILERTPEDTKIVTPDIVLHAYHKFFELTLEELEQNELNVDLENFIGSLHQNLSSAAKSNNGYLKERYQNLEAQIVLARVLFENKSPEKPGSFQNSQEENSYSENDKTVDSIANAKKILAKYSSDLPADLVKKIGQDLEKIYAAEDVGASPLFAQYSDTLITDYTQFTPRSHYTKNSVLRAYFRTMMYLGRSSYFLKTDVGIVDSNLLTDQIKTKALDGSLPLDSWNKIMTVTGFYAGQSDDLTYTEWQDFVSKILGGNTISSQALIDPANVKKMAQNLDQIRMPKILSDIVVDPNIGSKDKADLLRGSLAFRIFGQRFTFDAWVLNDLTGGQEKSEIKLPSMPSALFIPAAFGDAKAQNYSQEFLQKDAGFTSEEATKFLTKLEQKKSDISKVKKDEWFSSMGSAWLYVLGSLTHSYSSSHPTYMQSGPFLDKQIQTFLGSYAELKHDTLLYAKQSYAELGGGGSDGDTPPVVKGFVEPNMDFWNKFNQLLYHTHKVFVDNGLLKDHPALYRLQEFRKISAFYTELAKKELNGEQISDEDYEELRTTKLSFMAQPFDGDAANEDSGKVALIADIHTDAVQSKILYEATGKPYLMLASVGNEKTPRIVAGLTYNHYELTGSLGKRLTDEDWRGWVYSQPDKLPAKNFWYQSLIAK